MKAVGFSAWLALAGAGLAPARSEPPRVPPPQATVTIAPESRIEPPHNPLSQDWSPLSGYGLRDGVEALINKDFERAESILTRYLRRKPTHGEANLYLGVAQMNLGKWEEAKTHLKIAAKKRPNHPDARSRLGVAYAKLGDKDRALIQRVELERMANACKEACRLSDYIADGIGMIDAALAEAPAG